MPRIPKYRLHKASGQALVAIDGKRIYLGKYGTAASREKYRRLVAEWLTETSPTPADANAPCKASSASDISINEMILAYWHYAEGYYVDESWEPTKELLNLKAALQRKRPV